jgi:hypothetical protein
MLLGESALTGPLPSELGSLSLLVDLGFQGSGITGTVPTEFGRLTELGECCVSLCFLLGSLLTYSSY